MSIVISTGQKCTLTVTIGGNIKTIFHVFVFDKEIKNFPSNKPVDITDYLNTGKNLINVFFIHAVEVPDQQKIDIHDKVEITDNKDEYEKDEYNHQPDPLYKTITIGPFVVFKD